MRGLFVLSLVCASMALGAPARAGTSSIAGTVSDASGPAGYVCVDAYGDNWGGSATTGEDGRYVISGLYPGDYVLHFRDCHWPRRYASEYYDDEPLYENADRVSLRDGEQVTGIDAVMSEGGSISGSVTDHSGQPLSGICVWADLASSPSAYAETDSAGRYTVPHLGPGEYVVQFRDCASARYVTEWYDDATDVEGADPVTVARDTAVVGIDAALGTRASISGTVTDAHGNGLYDICVRVHTVENQWAGYTQTDGFGNYSVWGLEAGHYKVSFAHCWGDRFLAEWWDDATDFYAADAITLTTGQQLTGIDASLADDPFDDVALTGLSVRNRPVVTDYGAVGYTGWSRTVEVVAENTGERAVLSGSVTVRVCPKSSGRCRDLGYRGVSLAEGARKELHFPWEAPGAAGDFVVTASLSAYPDDDDGNDHLSVEHYVLVGGLGAGIDPHG